VIGELHAPVVLSQHKEPPAKGLGGPRKVVWWPKLKCLSASETDIQWPCR